MNHPVGSSLFPRNARTLALHMAMEAAQRAEIGQRIKELRGPLPQPELARRLHVSLRAVQKWEAGESAPQWENLVALSRYFHVTQDFVLYGDRSEPDAGGTQLDRIEAKLDLLLEQIAEIDPADFTEAITRGFENSGHHLPEESESSAPLSSDEAAGGTGRRSGARPASPRARAPRKQRTA